MSLATILWRTKKGERDFFKGNMEASLLEWEQNGRGALELLKLENTEQEICGDSLRTQRRNQNPQKELPTQGSGWFVVYVTESEKYGEAANRNQV